MIDGWGFIFLLFFPLSTSSLVRKPIYWTPKVMHQSTPNPREPLRIFYALFSQNLNTPPHHQRKKDANFALLA